MVSRFISVISTSRQRRRERERNAKRKKRVDAIRQAGRKEGKRERWLTLPRYINRSPTSGRRDLEKTYEGVEE